MSYYIFIPSDIGSSILQLQPKHIASSSPHQNNFEKIDPRFPPPRSWTSKTYPRLGQRSFFMMGSWTLTSGRIAENAKKKYSGTFSKPFFFLEVCKRCKSRSYFLHPDLGIYMNFYEFINTWLFDFFQQWKQSKPTPILEHSAKPWSFGSDVSYETTVSSRVRNMIALGPSQQPLSILGTQLVSVSWNVIKECCERRNAMILRFCFRACGKLFECRNGLCHCYFGGKNGKGADTRLEGFLTIFS